MFYTLLKINKHKPISKDLHLKKILNFDLPNVLDT